MAPKGIGKYCTLIKYFSPNVFLLKFNDENPLLIVIQTVLWNIKDTLEIEKNPQIDQFCIVCDEDDEYYKRAVIIEKHGDKYSCWLIDYGSIKLFSTIFKMQDDFIEFEAHSIKAGLIDLVDVTKSDFNFSENNNAFVRNLFEEAKKIIFHEEMEIAGVHYGQIFLTAETKLPFNLNNLIVSKKIAANDRKSFLEAAQNFSLEKFITKKGVEPRKIGSIAQTSGENVFAKKNVEVEIIKDISNKVHSKENKSSKTVSKKEEETFEDISDTEGLGTAFSLSKRRSRSCAEYQKCDYSSKESFSDAISRHKPPVKYQSQKSETSDISEDNSPNQIESEQSGSGVSPKLTKNTSPLNELLSKFRKHKPRTSSSSERSENCSETSAENKGQTEKLDNTFEQRQSTDSLQPSTSSDISMANKTMEEFINECAKPLNSEPLKMLPAGCSILPALTRQKKPKLNRSNSSVSANSSQSSCVDDTEESPQKLLQMLRRTVVNSKFQAKPGECPEKNVVEEQTNVSENEHKLEQPISPMRSRLNRCSISSTNSRETGVDSSSSSVKSASCSPVVPPKKKILKIKKNCSSTCLKVDGQPNINLKKPHSTSEESQDGKCKSMDLESGKSKGKNEDDDWNFTTELPTHSALNQSVKNPFTLGCSCENCKKMSVNEPEMNFKHPDTRVIIKPDPFLRSDVSEKFKCVLTKVPNHCSKKNDKILSNLLVHGRTIPLPTATIDEVNLPEKIIKVLKKINYHDATPVQSIGWPTLMRNENLCIVGNSGIGKTLSYVIPLCAFLHTKKERYSGLPKTRKGPLAMIFAKSSADVELIYDLFVKLLKEIKGPFINVAYAFPPQDKKLLDQFKKPIDILIATLPSLQLLQQLTDIKRLCHLVIEDLDIVAKKHPVFLDSLLNAVNTMVIHRSFPEEVQFMATSTTWTPAVYKIIGKLNRLPVMCIANPMQAALYGKADIQILDVKKNLRAETLSDILSKNNAYALYKTVVICKESELEELISVFVTKGIQFLNSDNTKLHSEIWEYRTIWENTPNGANLVLICTETSYLLHVPHLKTATFLVNYSLPDKFSSFVKRFSCLLDSYQCPYVDKSALSSFSCKILVFMDDTCTREFVKISNFFLNLNISIPQKMLDISQKMKVQLEEEKLQSGRELCDNIKSFGTCDLSECPSRHIVSKGTHYDLATNGSIMGKIMSFKHVNQCMVQLIEYRKEDGTVESVPNYSEKVCQYLENHYHFEKCEPGDLKMNGLYLFKLNNVFVRCKVYRVIPGSPLSARIEGLEEKLNRKVTIDELYMMPEELKKIPPGWVEVYVGLVIPPQNDSGWNTRTRDMVLRGLNAVQFDSEDTYFKGTVLLQLENTIWVDDIRLKSIGIPTEKFSLKKFLKIKQMFVESEEPIKRLFALCKSAGIPVIERKKVAKEVSYSNTQIDYQWAHLNVGNLNEVYIISAAGSSCIYLAHIKFNNLLLNLEKDIQKALENPLYNDHRDKKVLVGKCYLAKDPKGENYCRAMVTELKQGMAHCFFVDYGDSCVIPQDELKHLSDGFIKTLPFQAIECRLYGVDDLPEFRSKILDVIYDKFTFEDGTDFFRTLHAMVQLVHPAGSYGKRVYDVFLLDYSDAPLNINKLFIDSDLGTITPGESVDFAIPELVFPEPEDAEEEEEEESDNNIDKFDDDNDNFELIVIDGNGDPRVEEALEKINSRVHRAQERRAAAITSAEYRPMKAAPGGFSDMLTPRILWHQTATKVFLKIEIADVQSFEVQLIQNQSMRFCTKSREPQYGFFIKLYDKIYDQFLQESKGAYVLLTLEKESEGKWEKLVESNEPYKFISYNLEKFSDTDSDVETNENQFIGEVNYDEHDDGSSDDSSDYDQIYQD